MKSQKKQSWPVLGILLVVAMLSLAATVADKECKSEDDHHSESEGDAFCDNSSCDSQACKDPFMTSVGAGQEGSSASCNNCRPKTGQTCTLKTPSTVVDLYFRNGTCEFTNPSVPEGRGEVSNIDCHCDSAGGAVSGPTTKSCNC